MNAIKEFRNEYYFLSNFYEAPVTYEGITYQNNEAAFQSMKTLDAKERAAFQTMNPSEAKKYGRKVHLRGDWEQIKIQIMKDVVTAKFEQNQDLKEKLLSTGDAYLEEGNTWGDRIWGTVDGQGANHLGRILMEVREYLREKDMDMEK